MFERLKALLMPPKTPACEMREGFEKTLYAEQKDISQMSDDDILHYPHAKEVLYGEPDFTVWPFRSDGLKGKLCEKSELKPIWRQHNGRDLPRNAKKVIYYGEVMEVLDICQGWHIARYRCGGTVYDNQDSVVSFYHTGEYKTATGRVKL